MQQQIEPKQQSTLARWIKRFGFAGFMFFFIKGLLWLIIPALLIWFGISC